MSRLQRPIRTLPLKPQERGLGKEENGAYPPRSELLFFLFLGLWEGVEGMHKVENTTGVEDANISREVSERLLEKKDHGG